MLRWTPGKAGHVLMHNGRKYRQGDPLPGSLEDYAPDARGLISAGSSTKGPSAPAPVAKPAPIDGPAPAVDAAPQAPAPDLGALHWRRVQALAGRLGYDGDGRSKAARLAWLSEQDPAAVRAALTALEG